MKTILPLAAMAALGLGSCTSEAITPPAPEAGAPTVAASSTVDLMLNRDA